MSVRARWPGWSRQGTLMLPVAPGAIPVPDAPVTVDGVTLHPKHELHITLVGRALGHELGRVAGVREAFVALDWRWTSTGCRTLLRAPPTSRGRPDRHAIIQHVDLPAMGRFHGALGRLLGRTLPVPPPHVTLLVAGTRQGIGLPDPEALARHAVRTLAADDPLFTARA